MIKKDCTAACIVLCNYLDGAVDDLEQGNIMNAEFVYEVIIGLKMLGDSSYVNYLNRYNQYMNTKK